MNKFREKQNDILTMSSVIITCFSAMLGIYLSLFYMQEAMITYEITNSQVIDIYEDISNLQILYNNMNIRDKGQNLCILTIKIINNGEKDILNTLYDKNNPLGFTLKDGSIVDNIKLIDASSEYLKDNLHLTQNSSKVTFSDVILEKNEYFILNALVLHDKDKIPEVIPIGKIAGIKRIETKTMSSQEKEKSIYDILIDALRGTIFTHLIRFVFYSLIFIFIIITISYIENKLERRKVKKRKIQITNDFKRKYELMLNDESEFIFDLFIHGSQYPYINREIHKRVNRILMIGGPNYEKERELRRIYREYNIKEYNKIKINKKTVKTWNVFYDYINKTQL